MQALYTIFLKPCEGGYTARVPDVPGCVTGGATIEECVEMARDALCGCLCVYEDEGVELAPQRPLDALEHFRRGMEAVLGAGSCHILSVRPEGGVLLEEYA